MHLLTVRRRLAAVVVTSASLAALGGVALAQNGGTPPTLTYKLAAKPGTPTGPQTAAPGPTTFTATAPKGDHDFQVVRVADGAGVQDVIARLEKAKGTKTFETQLEAVTEATFVGGATAPSKFTTKLSPGTYLVFDITGQANKVRAPLVLTVSGDANGATAPQPVSTVTLQDYKFSLDRSLPRSGIVRFQNKGKHNHIVVVLKTQNAQGTNGLINAFKTHKGNPDKFIRGGGEGLDVIGPGQTVDLQAHYAKGTYVLACFWGDSSKASKNKLHAELGMLKAVTVK